MLKRFYIYVLILSFFNFMSYAQDNEDTETDDYALPKQTVTAQKREELLQKVPIAVSSIDSKRIEALQIGNIKEVGRISPNFNSYNDGSGLYTMISSRGIFTIDEIPVVGVYVDDIPMFNTSAFPSVLSDIERIEVLRGPQGTLYGRNTLAGAINIITKTPTNQTTGFASFGYGNLNQIEANAGISLPFIENVLFTRLGVNARLRDGYIENTLLETDNLLEHQRYGGNLQLTYLPTDKLTFSLNSSLNQKEVDAQAFVGGAGASGEDIIAQLEEKPYKVSFNTQGTYETLVSNNALKIGYQTDNLSIMSITSLQYTDNTGHDDELDFLPIELNTRKYFSRTFTTLSEELRINSEWKNLQWLAGVFVYNFNIDGQEDNEFGIANAGCVTDPDAATQFPYTLITVSEQQHTGFSIFGNAEYMITKSLRVNGGVRFEIEEAQADVSRSYTKDGNDNYQYPNLGVFPATIEDTETFTAVSPKVGLSYDVIDNVMLYGNITRGYRPGGFNSFAANEDAAKFNPEYSWNYEAGIKSILMQNRIRVNLTGFYIDYQDQQLYTIMDIATFNIGRDNLSRSVSIGAELETKWALLEGLTATLNVGVLDTEITEYKTIKAITTDCELEVEVIDYSGNKQGYSPQFNGNFGLNYEIPINDLLTLIATADYQFQTDIFFDPENTIQQDAYGLLNTRLVINIEMVDLILWGQNLTDETYYSYGHNFAGVGGFANYGLPRTFGSKLSVKF